MSTELWAPLIFDTKLLVADHYGNMTDLEDETIRIQTEAANYRHTMEQERGYQRFFDLLEIQSLLNGLNPGRERFFTYWNLVDIVTTCYYDPVVLCPCPPISAVDEEEFELPLQNKTKSL